MIGVVTLVKKVFLRTEVTKIYSGYFKIQLPSLHQQLLVITHSIRFLRNVMMQLITQLSHSVLDQLLFIFPGVRQISAHCFPSEYNLLKSFIVQFCMPTVSSSAFVADVHFCLLPLQPRFLFLPSSL